MQAIFFVGFSILINLGASVGSRMNALSTLAEWKYFDFDWPNPQVKQEYLEKGEYNFSNIVPIDVDYSNGQTFVTLIRTKGVPATLNTITNKMGPGGPLLEPYPKWSWYKDPQDCGSLINVYRVAIKCNLLWALDSGMIDTTKVCQPKLLAFDLSTDRAVKKINIPVDVTTSKTTNESLLITPVIKQPNCQAKPEIFIADVLGFGLIVMDENEKFHRIEDESFQPEDENSNYTIAGESFNLPDGLFGLALSPKLKNTRKRSLAFRPLASRTLNFAETSAISRATQGEPFDFTAKKDILPSQASVLAFSCRGALLAALTSNTAIACWNFNEEVTSENMGMAFKDPEKLQFVSGMKIIKNRRGEEIRVMSNRLQKIYAGTMNFDEINFRILGGDIYKTLEEANCIDS